VIQNLQDQLAIVSRTLTELVQPVLEDAEPHIQEQFQLTLATLGFISQRAHLARKFHRVELEFYRGFVSDVLEVVSGSEMESTDALRHMVTECDAVLQDPTADTDDYLELIKVARAMISEVIAASPKAGCADSLRRLVASRTSEFLIYQRVWMLPFGLDPKPEQLPDIEEVFS